MVIRSLADMKREDEKMMKMSEVSLWLYNYDDIFSDFDPRPFSERALSEDFLTEAKKIMKEKASGQLELKFSVPAKLRNSEKEKTIKKRLKEHFRKHSILLKNEKAGMMRKGILMAVFGLGMMFLAAYLKYINSSQFFYMLLFVILEPSGWFITWYGFDGIWNTYSKMNPEVEFYKNMTNAEISFMSY